MTDRSQKRATPPASGRGLRIAVKGILVLLAVGGLFVVYRMPAQERDTAPGEAPPVKVTVWTVTAEPEFADAFDLPAIVEPNRIVTISAEVAGRIEHLPAREGSSVRAGDLLVQLNTDLIQPQYEMAETQVRRDEIEFKRMTALVADNATPRRDLDNATSDLATSKAQWAEVRARLERTRIVAPAAGVLNDLLVETGEYVQAGMPVAQVVDVATVKVAVDVPERDVAFFAVGQETQVFVNVKGLEQEVTGRISFISELANQQTRSTRMEITVDNKDALVRSGQIVRIRLQRRVLKDVIMIPLLAVIPMEDSRAVFVVNSSEAVRRDVRLDIIRGDRVQVTSGLAPGDKLIVAGHRFVAPGQKVDVVSESK